MSDVTLSPEEIESLRLEYEINLHKINGVTKTEDELLREIEIYQDWQVYCSLKEKYPRWFEHREFNDD